MNDCVWRSCERAMTSTGLLFIRAAAGTAEWFPSYVTQESGGLDHGFFIDYFTTYLPREIFIANHNCDFAPIANSQLYSSLYSKHMGLFVFVRRRAQCS